MMKNPGSINNALTHSLHCAALLVAVIFVAAPVLIGSTAPVMAQPTGDNDDRQFQKEIAQIQKCGAQLLLLKNMALQNHPGLNPSAFDDVMDAVNQQLPSHQIVTQPAKTVSHKDLDHCTDAYLPRSYSQIIYQLAMGDDVQSLEIVAGKCLGEQTTVLSQATYGGIPQIDRMQAAIGMMDGVESAYAFLDELTEQTAGEAWLNKQRVFFDQTMRHYTGVIHRDENLLNISRLEPLAQSCNKIGLSLKNLRSTTDPLIADAMTTQQQAVACVQGLIYSNLMITDHFKHDNFHPSDYVVGKIARTYGLSPAAVPFTRDVEGLFLCPALGVRQAHIDILTTRATGHDQQQAEDLLTDCATGLIGAAIHTKDTLGEFEYSALIVSLAGPIKERFRQIYSIYTNLDEEQENLLADQSFGRIIRSVTSGNADTIPIVEKLSRCAFVGIDGSLFVPGVARQ